jgi:heme oxygenase (mycobilin-producing)
MIKVMVDRTTSDVDRMTPFLLELRAAAMQNPGYVSGETLVNGENPHNVITISTWSDIDDWYAWETSPERAKIYDKIGPIAGSVSIRRFNVVATD